MFRAAQPSVAFSSKRFRRKRQERWLSQPTGCTNAHVLEDALRPWTSARRDDSRGEIGSAHQACSAHPSEDDFVGVGENHLAIARQRPARLLELADTPLHLADVGLAILIELLQFVLRERDLIP